jgi:hypothetical protein
VSRLPPDWVDGDHFSQIKSKTFHVKKQQYY